MQVKEATRTFNLPLCFDALLSLLMDLLVMDLVFMPTLTVKPITKPVSSGWGRNLCLAMLQERSLAHRDGDRYPLRRAGHNGE